MGARLMTRMGDGTAVEMTRDEIRADIEDGVAAAVKRAKVPPLDADEIDHLLDIFASSARFTGVDVGDEVVLSSDGIAASCAPARVDRPDLSGQLGADLLELAAAGLLVQGRQDGRHLRAARHEDGPAPASRPRAVRRHARPGALLAARRADRQLVAAPAGGEDRRGPRRPGGGGRDVRERHGLLRRRSGRPAPTASTSTPPAPPATPTCWPRCTRSRRCASATPTWVCRSAWPRRWCSACTASSSTDGRRLAGMWPPTQMEVVAGGRRDDLRAGGQRQHDAGRSPGTSPGRAR